MSAFARFRSLVKRLRTPRPQGVILLYHRVASGLADPWRLCVSPEHFAEQLDVVASSWQPLALHDLAREEGTRSGSLPVAITFDDGYADNLQVAAPLLAERGLPASFFIVSGTIGSGRELPSTICITSVFASVARNHSSSRFCFFDSYISL